MFHSFLSLMVKFTLITWYSLSICYCFIWEYYLNSIHYFLRLNGKWITPVLFSFHKETKFNRISLEIETHRARCPFQVYFFQIDTFIHSNHIEWELTLSSDHHKSHHCFPFWSFISPFLFHFDNCKSEEIQSIILNFINLKHIPGYSKYPCSIKHFNVKLLPFSFLNSRFLINH